MKRAYLTVGLCALGFGLATQAAETNTVKPRWESSASLGATVTRGNSRTVSVSAQVNTSKKWERNEIDLGADGTYAEDRGVRSAGQARGFGQYNYLFTDRFYGYARLEVAHDAVADITYRITVSPGVGYYVIKNETTSLRGEIGPGYVYEKRTHSTVDYATLRLAERFEHKLNDRAKLWQSVEFLPAVDDFADYLLNFEVGIETQISKAFSLRTYAQDSYRSRPATGREKNDLRLVAAVAYKF